MGKLSIEQQFKRFQEEIRIYNEIGKALTSSLEIRKILFKIMHTIANYFRPSNWSLLLRDEDTQELYFEIAIGEAAREIKNIRIKLGEGIAGWVALHGKSLVIPDVTQDRRFCKKVDKITKFATESIIAVPIKIKGKVLGVIEIINKNGPAPLNKRELNILTTVADYAAIALENSRNYQRIHELTITDDTTGLYNARYLHQLIQREIERFARYHHPFSIVFFDLDHFKRVNDAYGHLVGSQMLNKVGRIILNTIRKVDYAVRYGGDEFIVLLPHCNKEQAFKITKRLRNAINSESFFSEEGLNIRITASFGIATYGVNVQSKDELLRLADEAMYKIKNSSRDGIALAEKLPTTKKICPRRKKLGRLIAGRAR